MKDNLEERIICCIIRKNELINELYVDLGVFESSLNIEMIVFFKKIYQEHKKLDIGIMINTFKDDNQRNKFTNFYMNITKLLDEVISPSLFYDYQEQLVERYRHKRMLEQVDLFKNGKITDEDLIDKLTHIQSQDMAVKKQNKDTPDEFIRIVESPESLINFGRFKKFNQRTKIKKNTINIIAARPSEGKSALSLNLFCDLLKNYKCIYFNMEMTKAEVYQRMLGIEAELQIKDVIKPQTEYQSKLRKEAANRIYGYNYEIINGSKSTSSIKTKIIKEQRQEHLIVFIDYVGYIVGNKGESDKDRIGNAVRELNNITKDYDCTIFIVAQINRNGAGIPTMEDLKDTGELEQTADTIILIHDANKENDADIKEVQLLIPKSRGDKRNIGLPIEFDKPKQRFNFKDRRF